MGVIRQVLNQIIPSAPARVAPPAAAGAKGGPAVAAARNRMTVAKDYRLGKRRRSLVQGRSGLGEATSIVS